MAEAKRRPNGASNHRDIVSLREYLECRIKEVENTAMARMCEMERATSLAADNLKARLESLNEWRAQNLDERAMFLTREAYDAKHALLQNQVDELRLSKATLEGKASQSSVYIAYLIGAIGIFLGLLKWLHK